MERTRRRVRDALLITELEEAIKLLQRSQGANTEELRGPLRAARCDAAWKLRYYLEKYRKDLVLKSRPMTQKERHRHGYHGRTFVYWVEERKRENPGWTLPRAPGDRTLVSDT